MSAPARPPSRTARRTAEGFQLANPPVLSRSTVLRAERLRVDRAGQVAGWVTARLVVVDEQGRTRVQWRAEPGDGVRVGDAGSGDVPYGAHGRLRTQPTIGAAPPDDAVLLGERDGVAYWAVRGSVGAEEPPAGSGNGTCDGLPAVADLRMAGAALDALGAGLFTTAVAVLNWHDTARFCARDGSPTHPGHAGWHRRCEAEGHEEYPRTDPAVICLVHDGADRVLLARQPVWPAGRFSVLAGFVEAGESLEACVLREIDEEVGITAREIRYLGSQAWPFPRSVMIGFHALADPDAPLRPADGEIAEAMWVTRDELRAALPRGDWDGRSEPLLLLPGRVSIARSMLESWVAHG